MRTSLRRTYREFPRPFWILASATFIDRVGGALLFPFFSLYITQKFNVGLTEVGWLFAIFSTTNLLGSVISGALTDRFGRKAMLMFGLVISGLSSVAMGLINDLQLFYIMAAFVGFFLSTGGPAQQAMVADLLPEAKRTEGFGIIRVVMNLAVTIGPLIGGLLATRSYLGLFIADAVSSVITAGIVFFTLPETKPQTDIGAPQEGLGKTMGGYGQVLQDGAFILFVTIGVLVTAVYMQMNTTLSVYLRDLHGVSAQRYGLLLSLNAAMVVVFQFWITRRIRPFSPGVLLAAASLLYAVGFGMYGVVSGFALFALAMAIITVGEMLSAPTAQAVAAKLAPADMRGRYMAVFGLSWAVPSIFAPLGAGIIMDRYNPDWVWYLAAVIGVLTALGFLYLQWRSGERIELRKEKTPVLAS